MDSFISPLDIAMLVALVISVIILAFASVVLFKILKGEIKMVGIIAESDGIKASLSRFQYLVFTFVIAGLYLVLSLESGSFVDIPESVLVLLGISGGSYLISKQIGGKPTPKGDAPDAPKAPNIAAE
ncbi:MAG: hypothetical protein HQ502_08010 [Alphaproteobacteria bacterium]|nr:hypothetical protein [Alphaproteobacteria bacterium]